jgi:hypothetical protein
MTQQAFKCPPQAPEAVEMMALRPRQERRSHHRLGRWIAPLVALQLLALGSPAWAAEVVALRVGQHPKFTRIVFELDAPSGYRLAHATGSDGSATVVVTLDAAARPQTVKSGSALVRSVTLDAAAGKATARIVLRTQGLPLKEMILSNPPRIVLDVLGTDTALEALKKKKAPRKKVATKTSPAREVKAEAPVQRAPQAPKPAIKPPTPAAKPVVEAKKPVPSRPAPSPTVKPPTPPQPPKAAVKKDEPAPALGTESQQAARRAMEARLKAVRDAADARRAEAEQARSEREAREAEKSKKQGPAESASATPEPGESEDSGIDPMLAGGIAGGVVLILALLVVMRRRRSLPKDLDVTMLSEDDASTPSQDAPADAMTETGFAIGDDVGTGASRDTSPPIQSSSIDPTSAAPGPDAMSGLEGRTDPPLSAPGLFEEIEKIDEPEKGTSTMDQEAHDPGMETVQTTPMHPATGTGDSGVAAMMREVERRMAHLETRLEEEMAARERLERQIAAQSEELRVQRAAIARTQRALRGLSRTDEEQATEPALRDPS